MSTEDEAVDAFKLLVFRRTSLDEPGQLKIITYGSGLKLKFPLLLKVRWLRKGRQDFRIKYRWTPRE
jgi:hypothetical protein